MSAKLKLVTVLVGLLYESVWRERGEVLEMDAARADKLSKKEPPLVAFGEHVLEVDASGEPTGKVSDAPVFTPAGFPCGDVLAAAGFTNVDQLGELIAAKGDAWFKDVPGLGKKSAALVAAAMPAPAAKPTKPAAPAAEPETPAPAAK